jgi:hypothetical protein
MRALARPRFGNPLTGSIPRRPFGQHAGPLQDYRARSVRRYVPGPAPQEGTSGFPLRPQESFQALANLFVGQVFSTAQGILASFYGLDKAGFLFKMPGKNFLYQIAGIPALLGGGLRQLRFQLRREMDFHCLDSSFQGIAGSRRVLKRPSCGWKFFSSGCAGISAENATTVDFA